MSRRGRKRQLEVESEYWRLISEGVGTVEACRRVGVSRKTGYRWRHENGGLPPTRRPATAADDGDAGQGNHPPAQRGRYLTLLERQRIAALRREGLGVRAIAVLLVRSPSTISRELRRNTARHDRAYDGDLAHSRAGERARGARNAPRVSIDTVLRALIHSKLELQWSPEQIAAYLRETFPARRLWHLCHETIYRAVYRGGANGLSRTLSRHLRTRRPMRRRRRPAGVRRPRFVIPATLIDHRPPVVQERSRIGDWEGDLIVGRQSKSAIVTLVERRSRLVKFVHLPGGHTAADLRRALVPALLALPAVARKTLTWDQGSEMADHDRIASLFQDGLFFAHPGSPWERGSNENTNGLARQYFPKGQDLSVFTPAMLADAETRLNGRPRKTLGWRTPLQVFAAEVAALSTDVTGRELVGSC